MGLADAVSPSFGKAGVSQFIAGFAAVNLFVPPDAYHKIPSLGGVYLHVLLQIL